MSLSLHCVFKQNGTTSTNPMSCSVSMQSTQPDVKSPSLPFSGLSSTANGLGFGSSPSSNGVSSSTSSSSTTAAAAAVLHQPSSSSCVSPCSTTASTPATTPQSPPPSYQVALSQRHGAGSWCMDARFPINHSSQANTYDYAEDYSDSDCSNMTEAEVAQMVLDIKDQSPGNSPRCHSPPDGNNNMDPALDQGGYWPHTKQHGEDKNIFFGSTFDMMSQHSRCMTNNKTAMYPPEFLSVSMMPAIKVEPDAYPSAVPQHPAGAGVRFPYPSNSMDGAQHMNDVSDVHSTYVLHNL